MMEIFVKLISGYKSFIIFTKKLQCRCLRGLRITHLKNLLNKKFSIDWCSNSHKAMINNHLAAMAPNFEKNALLKT